MIICEVTYQVIYPWYPSNETFPLLYHVPYLVKLIYITFELHCLVVLFTILDDVELSDLIGLVGFCNLVLIVIFGYTTELLGQVIGLLPLIFLFMP